MKRLIVILFVCSVLSCSPPPDNNVEIAHKMFEAFNKHEWEAMANFYSDPAMFLDPSYGKTSVAKSRKETIAKYREMQQLFPDINDEIIGIYPSGDKVTVEFISTGTGSDGSSFTLPIICVLTIKDGLIVKDATYYDQENP